MSAAGWRRRMRQRLSMVQGNRCGICGNAMLDGKGLWQHPSYVTLDHVHPKRRIARGEEGRHAGNLIAVHRKCNEQKDDRTPTGCELVMLAFVNAVHGSAA